MFKFSFQNTTRIHFGEGQIAAISRDIPEDSRILVTYGGGSIKKNGVYDQVVEALKDHTWEEFGGIEPNPQFDTLMDAVKIVQSEGYDYLLAVGGGSVVDGTKFIAAAAEYQGSDPWDICLKGEKVTSALPMGCILTLPATGSESNTGAVVSKGPDKLFFNSELVRPQFAVLDPAVTLSLPAKQVANGVVDAFVHTLEQYLTYPVNAKVQDRFSEGLLQTLVEEGPNALLQPEDLEVRSNIMWAATMALNGLIAVGVPQDWTTHMIGHEITALYSVDHARSLSIMLPAVMRHQRDAKREKLLQYGERVFNVTAGTEEERIDIISGKTVAFLNSMSVPTSLSAADLGENVIDEILAQLKLHGRDKLGEHGAIGYEQCKEILQLAC